MSTRFERCDESVKKIADGLLHAFEMHSSLLLAKVTIDLVFAYAEINEDTGEPMGDALKAGGYKALGICRKISLKDRTLGRSDAEIAIDGDWWKGATDEERAALLDHELHHLAVKIKKGAYVLDDLGRPELKLRKHDYQFGWFTVIAKRHGKHSAEQQQANLILEEAGQFFWPSLIEADHKISALPQTRMQSVEIKRSSVEGQKERVE